jgi:hypothetical protein
LKNVILIIIFVALVAGVVWVVRDLIADPLQGGTAGPATPTITPTPEPTPVDPSLVVNVDPSTEGETLTVNGHSQKQTLECKKFDRVYINGTGTTVIVKGACSQIMVNGDKNQVTADAAAEFVFNGTANDVTYARFVNGKAPAIIENQGGNDVQQAPPTPSKPAGTPKPK